MSVQRTGRVQRRGTTSATRAYTFGLSGTPIAKDLAAIDGILDWIRSPLNPGAVTPIAPTPIIITPTRTQRLDRTLFSERPLLKRCPHATFLA